MCDLVELLASQRQKAWVWVGEARALGQTCIACGHSGWESGGCLPVPQATREVVPQQRPCVCGADAHGD